jgi:hypothetical protein
MTAAGGVGVGEFVDQRDLRAARDQRIEVHLLQDLVFIAGTLARDDLKPLQQRLGLRPAVGLDRTDHDIGAGFHLGMRALQHLVAFADAGGGADEDLEPAGRMVFATDGLQQRIRRRSLIGVAALMCHKAL